MFFFKDTHHPAENTQQDDDQNREYTRENFHN